MYCTGDAYFTYATRLAVIIVNVNTLLAEMIAVLTYPNFALDSVRFTDLVHSVIAVLSRHV